MDQKVATVPSLKRKHQFRWHLNRGSRSPPLITGLHLDTQFLLFLFRVPLSASLGVSLRFSYLANSASLVVFAPDECQPSSAAPVLVSFVLHDSADRAPTIRDHLFESAMDGLIISEFPYFLLNNLIGAKQCRWVTINRCQEDHV